MRRRIPWNEIALMARQANGVWRLHTSLVAVDQYLYRHAQRRVRALRSDANGHYEFDRRNITKDRYGTTRFDLFIHYVPKGQDQ